MYDSKTKKYYDYWNSTGNSEVTIHSRDSEWYTGTPIWQANDDYKGGKSKSESVKCTLCQASTKHQELLARCTIQPATRTTTTAQ